MTKDQLINKWAVWGIDAAKHDQGMTPCYAEEIEHGHDDVLCMHREGWECTSHFQTLYGDKMYTDALEFFIHLGNLGKYPDTEAIIDLKTDFLEAFWDAWEDEVGAYDLIEEALAGRIKTLALRMLDMLEITGDDVRFTEEAIAQRTAEFQALGRWVSKSDSTVTFLLEQAYYMLDCVTSEGLDNIESGYPEPDIYTAGLTDWLSGTVHNLWYVTEALSQGGIYTDGVVLLQEAQRLAIRDAWTSLAQMLKGLLE